VAGLSRLGRATSSETALEDKKLPQSQPMQRSINAQLLSESDTEYSPSPPTPPNSEKEDETYQDFESYSEDLGSPLSPENYALLRILLVYVFLTFQAFLSYSASRSSLMRMKSSSRNLQKSHA